ncbi:MAG: DUF1801 domain-containing protein [Roseivivax sp.]|nr:DUF1801 domain-containing protein [Roseivivax sp.]
MSDNLTRPTGEDVSAFLAAVEPPRRRDDALRLAALFEEATGWRPALWRGGIVGYGQYDYRYDSGRSGRFLATGFAPRKAATVVYIMPGYGDFADILARLGPHRLGKSCLYLSSLERVDLAALRALIRAGLDDLARRWPVSGG